MYSLNKTVLVFIISLSTLLLSACGSMESKKEQKLDATIALFKEALRWKSDNQQRTFFVNPENANLPSGYGLRVVDIQVTSGIIAVSENERILETRLYYLNEGNQSVRIVGDTQRWRYSDKRESWQRVNPMPTPK